MWFKQALKNNKSKVATKNPDENVAVLKSATTYKGDKYFWEDELELEKIIERVFF